MLNNPTHTKKLKLALSISLASAMLVGCGSGGGGSDSSSAPINPPVGAQNSIVSGSAIKGAINLGVVKAYPIEIKDGKAVKAAQALPVSALTDENGEFSLDLGDDYRGQRLVLEVSADAATEMVCDVADGCGNGIDFGDLFKPANGFSIATLVSVNSVTNSVSVSPLTGMALSRSYALDGGLNTANFEAAKGYIEQRFELDTDTLDVVAADITRLDGQAIYTKAQLEHGIVSGALLALVNGPDWDGIDEVLEDVNQRLAAGGQIADLNAGNQAQVTMDDIFYNANEITQSIIDDGLYSSYSSSFSSIAKETKDAYDNISNPPVPVDPVVISSQPQGQSVEQGESASFAVVAQGGGELSYQWFREDQRINGANSAQYSIASTAAEDAGRYFVEVSNSVGTVRSQSALLRVSTPEPVVLPVEITSSPRSATVTEGDRVEFVVTATGGGTLSYQWRKDNQDIAGANTNRYVISRSDLADAGSYVVVVSNSVGSELSSAAQLIVNEAAPVISPVEIVNQPQNATVEVGQTAQFSVGVRGGGELTFQWRLNGRNIAGANGSSYSVVNAQQADAGNYDVLVSNAVSDRISSGASLTVTEPQVEPVQIVGHPQSLIRVEGTQARFVVSAQGGGTVSYQWRLDGVNITGANANSYTIDSVQQSDEGLYTVIVENSTNSVTSLAASLIVNEPPVEPVQITGQPQSASVLVGQQASFTVVAQGGGTVSYQWRVNGNNIAGATSASYTLNNVQLTDAGAYDVLVSNSEGQVVSSEAQLQVSEPAPVTKDVSLSWDIPSEREDGSALAMHEINGYVIHYGTVSGQLDQSLTVDGGGATTAEVEGLLAGTYYFAIATVDSDNVRGAFSAEISTTIQ